MVLDKITLLLATTTTTALFILTSLLQTQIGVSQPTTVPTMAECAPRLLTMASCASFVEGQVPTPPIQCCAGIKQVYDEKRDCLCLLLNGTALPSIPINSTLAVQLPALCSPQIDPSFCSAASSERKGRSRSPPGPGGGKTLGGSTPGQGTTTESPKADEAPSPSNFGLKNLAYKLKSGQLGVVAALVTLILAKLL